MQLHRKYSFRFCGNYMLRPGLGNEDSALRTLLGYNALTARSRRKEAHLPSLKDQVVIITGAGSGIGHKAALLFAKEGAKTVLADINEERLPPVIAAIEELGREAIAVPTDVSKREHVDRMVGTAIERFGRVDILVNNAGYGYGATIEQTSEAEFQQLWETNVLSVLFGMQAVLPIMREQRSGHIISVASAAGKIS